MYAFVNNSLFVDMMFLFQDEEYAANKYRTRFLGNGFPLLANPPWRDDACYLRNTIKRMPYGNGR